MQMDKAKSIETGAKSIYAECGDTIYALGGIWILGIRTSNGA